MHRAICKAKEQRTNTTDRSYYLKTQIVRHCDFKMFEGGSTRESLLLRYQDHCPDRSVTPVLFVTGT